MGGWERKEEVTFKSSPGSSHRSNHRNSQGRAFQKEGADVWRPEGGGNSWCLGIKRWWLIGTSRARERSIINSWTGQAGRDQISHCVLGHGQTILFLKQWEAIEWMALSQGMTCSHLYFFYISFPLGIIVNSHTFVSTYTERCYVQLIPLQNYRTRSQPQYWH